MADKVLWFTSFNKELYNFTGRNCTQSFKDKEIYGDLFTFSEGFECNDTDLNYDLDNSVFLQKWLLKNKDIIPHYMGGEALECSCSENPYGRSHHKRGCHFTEWNRQASRWFRKIACYHYVLNNLTGYDYYIWIDCDNGKEMYQYCSDGEWFDVGSCD